MSANAKRLYCVNKYPLQAFLRVCAMREEQSQRELSKARDEKIVAEQALQKAIEVYNSFKLERPKKEKLLFTEIKGEVVSQKRLDEFHIKVKQLVDKEQMLADEVNAAKTKLKLKQNEEEQAHAKWLHDRKEQAKILEHHKLWSTEQKLLQEKAEEAEAEGL